ncbi:MAG: hypothetical protein EOO70_03090 [Myxococcaceae bacterium]|nr:MAG: hypothetical protein EOO70_03090 [Myxococcaceae bacterium]
MLQFPQAAREPALSPDDLVITAMGMVSSLGPGVVQGCAAARGGLTRWAELDVDAMDDDELRSVPLRGHAIQGLTNGFAGMARFLRLGDAALLDMLAYGASAPDFLSGAHFLLHLPDDTYDEAHFERMEQPFYSAGERDKARRLRSEERAAFRGKLARRLLPELLALHGIRTSAAAHHCSFGGPAGFATCLLEAERLLRSRATKCCVLGGIDSLVAGDTLRTLQELGLVQHGHNPDGFFPGEGAAFLCIERFETARARGARVEAWVGAAAHAREEASRFSGRPPTGAGLFQAIHAAYRRLGPPAPTVNLAIGNLNGSSHRANDFANTLVRLGQAGLPRDFRQWSTATSFGELGAATGAVATCLGVRAFVRGYANTPHALVWLESDGGDRGAFFLGDVPSREDSSRRRGHA